jgi:hypothetical protein
MNEMYNMGIATHYYSVIGILLVILVNIWMLNNAKSLSAYKRQMRIFTPIGSVAIGGIVFTGVIMMAAKHLDFTIENILMILFAITIIVLEAKRAKTLKYLSPKVQNGLENFKTTATYILLAEVVLVMSISIWMWTL